MENEREYGTNGTERKKLKFYNRSVFSVPFRLLRILCCLLPAVMLPTAGGAGRQAGGLWASDRIIDIHGHIGEFRGFDLSTETLLSNIDRYGVALVLVSNIDGAELPDTTANTGETATNRVTVETVRKYPDRLRGILWTRPKDGSPARIEAMLKETLSATDKRPIFVGMKIHPEMNGFQADDPRVDGYMKLCEKYTLPAVFHSGKKGSSSAPEKIYALARRHPRVPVILYHMGFGRDHAHAIAVAREAIAKRDAQLYLETAQADPEAVLQAVRALGAARVLFGTDATYYGRDHYARYETLLARLKRELPAEDYALIIRGNAERLFNLK
jgi:predicted TIM-barrel fold metal-dependent hydrolase